MKRIQLGTWLVVGFVALINIIHPFIHGFEGGGLDAMLCYMDGFFMSSGVYLPFNYFDHEDHHHHHNEEEAQPL